MSTVMLAHQGGWDEALMVLVPIGILAALLVLATRRAKAARAARDEGPAGDGTDV